MKTLEDLHKKIWYRALQVIYVLVFLLVLIFGIFSIYEINKNTPFTKTVQSVKNQEQPKENLFDTYMQDPNISKQGKAKMLSDLQSGNMTEEDANGIISKIYGDNIPTNNPIQQQDVIQSFLNDETQDNDNIATVVQMLKDNVPRDIINKAIQEKIGYSGEVQAKELSIGETIFNIENFRFVLFTILFLGTSYLIFFQILNRIFYYIVLGTLFPKKD